MTKLDLAIAEEQAIDLLEEARNTVEKYFYMLRDDVLDAGELADMRIALRDAKDTIGAACRHIERIEREVGSNQ